MNMDHHDFSYGLQQLKLGECIARTCWPKGMFLYLVLGSRFKVNRAPLINLLPEGTEIDYHSHIDLFYGDGRVTVFTPSQQDLLACDYYIVIPPAEAA
jgi:hypothetical protein